MRQQVNGLITFIVLLAGVVGPPMAIAIDGGVGVLDFEEMKALVIKVEPTYREISLWDYVSGRRRPGLQVGGTVDLGHFKVGDYVLARVGVSTDLLTDIRVIAPPEGDKRFEAALRYVLSQAEKQAP